MFDRFLSIPWAVNMLGPDYARVVNMTRFCVNFILKIISILNVSILICEYSELSILSSEYAKVLNVSVV